MAGDAEFDGYAARYDQELAQGLDVTGEGKDYYARGRMAWLAERLAAHAAPFPHTVLDFGCGLGASTPLFFEQLGAQRVVGVDVSTGLLDRARRELAHERRVRFATLAEHEAPGSADVAFVNGVFHHIPDARTPTGAGVRRSPPPHSSLTPEPLSPRGPLVAWR